MRQLDYAVFEKGDEHHKILHQTFKMCLNLEKLEEKKKIWKVTFFSWFDLSKVKKKKIERKNVRKTCVVIKKKIFFQI